MAITRITKGVIKPNENYDTHNIVSTGIVTAVGLDINGNADISGSLSVGGVLTYEDVTSIDSVGIITAQKDIHVGAGVSVVGIITATGADINGDLDVDGHTNLDNVSVAGVTTFNANVKFDGANAGRDITFERSQNSLVFADDALAKFGNSEDFKLFHDGSNSYIRETGTGSLVLQSNETKIVNGANNETIAKFIEDGAVELYHNNSKKLETYSGGVSVSGSIVASGNIQANTNITISNINPQLFLVDTNNDSDFALQNTNGTFVVKDTTNSANRFTINSSGNATFAENLNVTGDLDVDGHTNLDNVSVAGVSTFSGILDATNTPASIRVAQDIQHKGDADTKITFPAADTVTIETAGSERLRIKSDGKVGVGTDSPLSVLTAYGENRGEGTVTGQITAKDNAAYNASPTAGIVFQGHYASNNAQAIFSGITGFKENANDGNLAGALAFHIRANGAVAYEALRIDSSGRFLLGTSASRTIAGHSPRFTLNGDDYNQATLQITSNQNGTSGTFLQFSHQRSGSAGGNTILQDGDDFGRIRFTGGDGTNIDSRGAEIIAQVDGTPGVDDMPGRLLFMTTADGAQSTTERLRITSGGMLEMRSDMSASDQANRNIFRFTDTDTSTVSNQSMGRLQWFSSDASGGGACVKAEIEAVANDSTPEANLIFKTHTSSNTSPSERMRISGDGRVTVGDGNNLADNYVTNMLIDGGDNSKLSIYGSSTGSGTIAFPDSSSSGAERMAGFIQMNHTSTDNGPRLNMGLNDTTLVHIRVPGSNRGQLEVYGNFNESTTPAIEISDGGDARKVFLTNSSGDFNALTRNGSQTKGQLKMFESGVLLHNMKDPDSSNTLQTFRTFTYRNQTGSTNTSTSPDQTVMMKGGSGTYDCFEEGNMNVIVNGNNNDHYQPVAFVPRGYDLDTTSFGGQWAGEMWIHQTGSQNPTDFGYSGYNTWATMSFKCKWDCAHWNAKPNGFWVEHYINQGRAQIGKIDASSSMSQFVIYLLPGNYWIRYNCVRGMAVHRAVSAGGSITLRDGGSFATYNTLAYSSRNTNFDSEISQGSANQAYTT